MAYRRWIALALVLSALPAAARASSEACAPVDGPNHSARVADAAPGSGPLRVFAMQYRQLASYAETYGAYREKMICLMDEYVRPNIDPSKTSLVVFNEDIGLATLATGSRGAAARVLASSPVPLDTPALYNTTGVPAGAAAALASVAAGYARQIVAYRKLFPFEDPRKGILTAATDTFVRGFMTTFSKLARAYGVYVVASNNQGDFRYSTDAADVAAFADPDLAPFYASGDDKGVWVATSEQVWNEALLFAPYDVRPAEGFASADPSSHEYDPRTNLLFVNKKVPLTQIEKDFLALDEGDMSESNTGPVSLPEVPQFKLGFAISLPAFEYGAAEPVHVCDNGSTWMRCLNARGVNTVIQPEANPGPWAHYGADGNRWQALTWGASTVRAVTDPTVGFNYIVCPHMVGNLLDLPFDGQSAILQRGRTGPGRHYVGARDVIDDRDRGGYEVYAGEHPEFLALAPWVIGDNPALSPADNRAQLQTVSDQLQGGSLSPLQNGYLETAIYADLDTPS